MSTDSTDAEVDVQLPDDLARRPCFAPGVQAYLRKSDEVQIGLNPRRSLRVSGLPPRMAKVIRSIDGRTPLGRLLTRAGPQNQEALCSLLRDLVAHGYLIDAADPRPARRLEAAMIGVRGDGPLAAAVAAQFAIAGVDHLVVDARGAVCAEDLCGAYQADDLGQPRTKAIERVVHTIRPSVTVGSIPGDRSPDLVVLADSLVPPPDVVRQFMAEGQEHLVVAVRDGCGIVGPLVLPGRTACLECCDRYRTDRDPRWPRVANQLTGRIQRTDAATTQAIAAVAVKLAMQALQPTESRPVLADATIEVDLTAGETLRREWLPHPLCRCGAGGGWEVAAA